MFQPGDAVGPGRGQMPHVPSPEDLVAQNPLGGYPNGYSPSCAIAALALGSGFGPQRIRSATTSPRRYASAETYVEGLGPDLRYNERPDSSEDLGEPPTGPLPPGFPVPDPAWDEPLTESLAGKFDRLGNQPLVTSLPPGSYTKRVLFKNRAWKQRVQAIFDKYGPPTDEENQRLLDCRDMPHEWLRAYLRRVREELATAVEVMRVAFTSAPGGEQNAQERRNRAGALARARAALDAFNRDPLLIGIVGWTQMFENSIGRAPDNR